MERHVKPKGGHRRRVQCRTGCIGQHSLGGGHARGYWVRVVLSFTQIQTLWPTASTSVPSVIYSRAFANRFGSDSTVFPLLVVVGPRLQREQ
jgi:hypothetical protein